MFDTIYYADTDAVAWAYDSENNEIVCGSNISAMPDKYVCAGHIITHDQVMRIVRYWQRARAARRNAINVIFEEE